MLFNPSPIIAQLSKSNASLHSQPGWLKACAVFGLLVGVLGAVLLPVLEGQRLTLPESVVARVGERLIRRDEWLRAVAAVASERRTALTSAQQQQVLERLIDEELLVQYGVSQGLVQHNLRLRTALVGEVIQATSESERSEVSDALLQFHFARNYSRFALPDQLVLRVFTILADGTRAEWSPALPHSALAPTSLRSYLGPSLTEVAMAMQKGEVRRVKHGLDQLELHLDDRIAVAKPQFAELRSAVLADFQRTADEAAVARLLKSLRKDAKVVLADAVNP